MSGRTYHAFGLTLVTELQLPGRWGPPTNAVGRVVEIVIDDSVPHELPGSVLEWAAPIDGSRLTLDRGRDGDFLFRHGSGRHLLSTDATMLRCAPTDARDPAWFRVLLDSVLLCTALLGGMEGLHAGSVILGGRGVAVTAAAGGGKSTLLCELTQRGHTLISDDITFLRPQPNAIPLALPGAPVMTLPRTTTAIAGSDMLMELPGEKWVSHEVADGPAPLRAIVQLDRRAGARTAIASSVDAPRLLLAALLALPRTPARSLARLDLASVLARHCRILTLTADTTTKPGELADLVELAASGD